MVVDAPIRSGPKPLPDGDHLILDELVGQRSLLTCGEYRPQVDGHLGGGDVLGLVAPLRDDGPQLVFAAGGLRSTR